MRATLCMIFTTSAYNNTVLATRERSTGSSSLPCVTEEESINLTTLEVHLTNNYGGVRGAGSSGEVAWGRILSFTSRRLPARPPSRPGGPGGATHDASLLYFQRIFSSSFHL